jgi:hypothetical protein
MPTPVTAQERAVQCQAAAPKPTRRKRKLVQAESRVDARPLAQARELVREHLKHGPAPGAAIEAAAQAAAIPKPALIAAAEALGVRTKRGEWWLPR